MASAQHMKELFDVLMRLDDMFPPDAPSSDKNAINGSFRYSGTTRYASGRNCNFSYIKENIQEWKELKICSMADNGMCLAVYGLNGYAYTNDVKNGMKEVLSFARSGTSESINDVSVNSNGAVMLLVGRNGYSFRNTSSSIENRMKSIHAEKQKILSVSQNENDEWIIVTEKYYYTSGSNISAFVQRAQNQYGAIDYAYITRLGRIAICRQGIYYENIPSILEENLKDLHFKPDNIKFTDSGYYCISNKDGNARYML